MSAIPPETTPPPDPPSGSLEQRNRRALLITTAVLGTGMLALLLAFPNGSAALKNTVNAAPKQFVTEGRPTLGTGTTQILVFSDYQCPACKEFNERHLPGLIRVYVDTGKARITELHSPIFGAHSEQAAAAAECVFRQNRAAYWTYSDALFKAQGPRNSYVTPELLRRLLPETIKTAAFEQCLRDPDVAAQVKADLRQHQRAGLEGTPTIFVNGKRSPSYGAKSIGALVDAAQ